MALLARGDADMGVLAVQGEMTMETVYGALTSLLSAGAVSMACDKRGYAVFRGVS